MRKVLLRMNEQFKYDVIKKLVESNGNKKRAAAKLNCTTRTVNRLIILYKSNGKQGFIHGNRGKLPSTTIPFDTKHKIIQSYINDYSDTNFTHFCEIIREDFNVSISDTTLNSWLKEEYVLSPKARRKTKSHMKKLLNHKANLTKSEKIKNEIKASIAIIDSSSAHPRRPRCKYMGEMIQMDASVFEWLPGSSWHLHLAVDDASGKVVGAYFDYQETLFGYYNVFYQILTHYGIPALFYTDRRTVFEYKRKINAFDNDDTYTQFAYACKNLGVDIKTTSVAQAKGRIERMNQTFQSRLPIELRRASISSIEDANKFLEHYLPKFNDQFSLHLNPTKSVFEVQPSIEKINHTLAVLSERKVDAGHCIKYKNKYYLTISPSGMTTHFKRGTTCLVIESFDGHLYANVLDQIYLLEQVPSHHSVSLEFDSDEIPVISKKRYIPPFDHPWRLDGFLFFKSQHKHLDNGANV